jgi:hypothetical protein
LAYARRSLAHEETSPAGRDNPILRQPVFLTGWKQDKIDLPKSC